MGLIRGSVLRRRVVASEAGLASHTELAEPSDSAERLRQIGDHCRDNRLWAEAGRYYGEYLAMCPKDFAIWVQRGNCLKEAGCYPEALDAYDQAIALNSTDADVFLQRGHLQKQLGNRGEAVSCYRASLELKPHDNDALRELVGLGARAEAEAVLREADPEHLTVIVPSTPSADDLSVSSDSTTVPIRSRPRILFISDSLGTPIHARGIFNYSIALVEMLARLGAEITLVVEMADGYAPGRHGRRDNDRHILPRKPSKYLLSSAALNSWLLSEVFRYFNSETFSFEIPFRNKRIQRLYEKMPELVRFLHRCSAHFVTQHRYLIANSGEYIDFIPAKGGHLRKFDRLLYVSRFYSDSMSRAVKGLTPVSISGAGYDAVVIDTPHYVRVTGINPSRICTVVHDLIPFRDPLMSSDWRAIFMAKLSTSLQRKENLIFVSEYTRFLFHSQFPSHKPNSEVIIHPAIRNEQISHLTSAVLPRESFLHKISESRSSADRRHIEARFTQVTGNAATRARLVREFKKTMGCWDSSLPYFASALSDEPRKNIKIFCEVARDFIGKCNFIIMGQINGNAYMNHEPELYPNLHFTGFVSNKDKNEVLQNASGVIFPSFAEGFGIPVVEGALFGKPILCSDIPVFREITDNLAIYFDPYRPDELSFQIDMVLAEPARYIGNAAALRQSVINRFSQAEMQKRLHRFLQKAGMLV